VGLHEKIRDENDFIKSLEKSRGTRCPRCFGIVSDDNCTEASLAAYEKINEHEQRIEAKDKVISEENGQAQNKEKIVQKLIAMVDSVNDKIQAINQTIADLNQEHIEYSKVPKPEVDVNHLVLQKEIEELRKQAMDRKKVYEGPSPFVEIFNKAVEEKNKKTENHDNKKHEIDLANDLMPYYDYWVEAFGDSGIRKIIIDGIIPALNERVAYWMDYLLDGTKSLVFDNELNETVENSPPDGDPFNYHNMSAGEQRMLNLAVSQAFAHVMALSYGASPSFVFLDEAASNMDEIAKQGVYDVIRELSSSKQVFVTTHDPYLLNLLEGCDQIGLRQKDKFTKLITSS
jgi:DNA repair exonuclease SbcCD ATPase subunit